LEEYKTICDYFIELENPAFVKAIQLYEKDIMLVLLKVELLAFDTIAEQFTHFMQKSVTQKIFNQG